MKNRIARALCFLGLALVISCNANQPGDSNDAGTDDGGMSIDDGGIIVINTDGGTYMCRIRTCQGKTYLCGNCLDDDQDGLFDEQDPDCLGSCDNSENGLDPQIPGLNNAPCKQDCFFDQDTGSGNDQCEWDHQCDSHEVAPNFYPEPGCNYDPNTKFPGGASCSEKSMVGGQSKACGDFCGALTPNGCDCFGCCILGPQAVDPTQGIWLGSADSNKNPSCTIKDIADPAKCHVCQTVPACYKPCGRCQLCIGKTTLPADCMPAGTCPDSVCGRPGYKACGQPGCAPCDAGYYCTTGCCFPIIG